MLNRQALHSVIASINIGEPTSFGGWKVFPLFPTVAPAVSLVTVRTAIDAGFARVEELPTGPAVRALHMHNVGPKPVLVRDGDIFVAGRQDRIADRPMLVASGRSIDLPVSCVEQNRWAVRDRDEFTVCPDSAELTLRHRRMSGTRGVERPDQQATWSVVGERRRARGLANEGGSLVEVQQHARGEIEAAAEALPPVYGAAGLALCHDTANGPRAALVEWFADPSACADAWNGSVRGTLASLPMRTRPPRISRMELRWFLKNLTTAPKWVASDDDSIGSVLGLACGRTHGRALVHEGRALHFTALHA